MQAIIENGICVGVANVSPGVTINGEVVSLPAGYGVGDLYANGVWAKGESAAPKPPKVSVIEYKMLFTSAERIAVKASTDPVIVDLQELMNDPRTVNVDLSLKSISDALDYMTALGLIAAGRKAEILTGVVI